MEKKAKKKKHSFFKKYILVSHGAFVAVILLMLFAMFTISTEGAVYTYYAFEKVIGSDEKYSYTVEEMNESNTVCKFNGSWYLLPYEDVTELERISFSFRLDIDDNKEIAEVFVILKLENEILASQTYVKENGEKITLQDSFSAELNAGEEITLRRSNAQLLTVEIFADSKTIANIVWDLGVG